MLEPSELSSWVNMYMYIYTAVMSEYIIFFLQIHEKELFQFNPEYSILLICRSIIAISKGDKKIM